MTSDLVELLEANVEHPCLASPIGEALMMLRKSNRMSQRLSPNFNSSLIPAAIWRNRHRVGNLRAEAFRGIDETVRSLGAADFEVKLGLIETENGLVAIWLRNQQSQVAGVIVACADWTAASEDPIAMEWG